MFVHYREAKQHVAPINFAEVISEFGSIYAAKCNCNATKVAVVINKVCSAIFSHIFLFNVKDGN